MTDQLSLLDLATDTQELATPRCRMCARPARWITTAQEWAMYCAGKACSNRERICQQCGEAFTINVDGAGTKYCSTRCKADGYRPHQPARPSVPCAWCGTLGWGIRARAETSWPYICQRCIDPIKHVVARLKNHHVPHDRARQLAKDPACEICGRDLLAKERDPATGKYRAWLVVDHDHACCPADKHSCGECIRGLICHHCNIAAGMLRDSPTRARRLADYLECWFSP